MKTKPRTWRITLPQAWHQLSLRQFRALWPLGIDHTPAYLKASAVARLLPVGGIIRMRLRNETEQQNVLAACVEALAWMDPPPLDDDDAPPPTATPMRPWLRAKYAKRLYLPLPGLADMYVEEWMLAAQEWQAMAQGDADAARRMAGILARPQLSWRKRRRLPKGQVHRQPFDPDLTDWWAAQIEPEPWLSWVLHRYMRDANALLKHLFPLSLSGGSSNSEGYGWFGMVLSIAADGPFGPASEVKRQWLLEVMAHSERQMEHQRRMEEKMKRKNK